MTDELYDYFGGNASKKVEPIEDDDLDTSEEEVELIQPTEDPGEVTTENPSKPERSPEPAGEHEPVYSMETEEVVTEEPAVEQEKKKGSHWDFLANMLGISPAKPEATIPADESTSLQPVAEDASASEVASKEESMTESTRESQEDIEVPVGESTAVSDKPDFFGLEPIPSDEASTVLPSMFGVSETGDSSESMEEDPNMLIGWDPSPPRSEPVDSVDMEEIPELIEDDLFEEAEEAEAVVSYVEDDYSDSGDDDDDDDFVEFEIEDLDDSPLDEDRARAHGRNPRRRKPPVENANVEPAKQPRSHRTRNRSEEIREVSSEDESSVESKSEAPSSRRSRGSRGGRGRGDRPRSGESSKRHTAKKDDFVPDDLEPVDLPPFAEGLEDLDLDPVPIDLERPDSERSEAPRTGRKRRRRRGSKGRSEKSEPEQPRVAKDEGFGAGIDDEDEFELDVDDSAAYDSSYRAEPAESGLDDFDQDSSEDRDVDRGGGRGRNRGRGRGRGRGRTSEETSSRSGETDLRSTDERKRAKVPTWDEAITVLIDSNIENHKKSGSGQPRRGGSRGGGNRGDGNRGDGNRGDGNRGQNRGRRRVGFRSRGTNGDV